MKKLLYLFLAITMSCGDNYEKVEESLIKFDKKSQRYTYLDEPFTGIGFEKRRKSRVRLYYYQNGVYKKREQGVSNNGDINIDIMQSILYQNISEVGDVAYEHFYVNGAVKEKHIIQEILSTEVNSVNTVQKIITYDEEGNIISTKTEKDYIYIQPQY